MNYRLINERLKAIKADPSAYNAWLANPMTQDVIGILTVLGQPACPQQIDGHVASLNLGHSAGWAGCLNKLQMLDERPTEEVPSTFDEEVEKKE